MRFAKCGPRLSVLTLLLLAPVAGCAGDGGGDGEVGSIFRIGAVPDQDPEKLQRLYGALATYLQQTLGVPVVYEPVTDYVAAVIAFRVGDLDMVWFGGLTGVQARLQVEGAEAILQRSIDAEFHSVFIANSRSGWEAVDDVAGLARLEGHTFTFGSESSTSGRLMPQYYLEQAGLTLADFRGEVGFSGSHDKTIKLVEAGTFSAGALNEQVWRSRVASGDVDLAMVDVIWRTPAYYDYHWLVSPLVGERFGAGFVERVRLAFTNLDAGVPRHKEILDLFGAQKFVATQNSNYDQIESIGRAIGKIK